MGLRARLSAALVLAVLAPLAAALVAAPPAAADIAPPYQLTAGATANELVARPLGDGSTLAVGVDQTAVGVDFSPLPSAPLPTGCASVATAAGLVARCVASRVSTRLELNADIVQVEVNGLITQLLRVDGGAEADAISVNGPVIGPAASVITKLEILSGAGPDTIVVGGRVSQITDAPGGADADDDRYTITSTSIVVPSTLSPGGGDDLVRTADADLTINGGEGNDTLLGPGALHGGEDDDVLKPTSATRVVNGGTGRDRLSYEALAALPSPQLLIELQGAGGVNVTEGGVTTPMTGIEQVEGGPGNDALIGSDPGADPLVDPGADMLAGGGGDDILRGRGGADDLAGGPGRDLVSYVEAGGGVTVNLATDSGGPAGAVDALRGIEGVIGSGGSDSVTGTALDESFDLGSGDDAVSAGAGNDVLAGGPGNDALRGGPGADAILGQDGTDTALYDERGPGEPLIVTLLSPGDDGAAGENDTLLAVENVAGGAGNDVLSGDDGPNALAGNAGNDTISGLDGADVLRGGDGRDIVAGDLGSDELFGDAGDDSLLAFDNIADALNCGDGADDDAQVDGLDRVESCEFARRLDVLPPADLDGDGVIAGTDCNDRNAAIRPGAPDPPADGIDQNCDGRDTALPVLAANPSIIRGAVSRRGTPFAVTEVTRLPAGGQVTITCRTTAQFTRGCPFSAKTRRLSGRARAIKLRSLFRNDPRDRRLPRRLPVGTRIELTISAPGFISQVVRFTMRRTSAPRRQDLCLPAGDKAPSACPASP